MAMQDTGVVKREDARLDEDRCDGAVHQVARIARDPSRGVTREIIRIDEDLCNGCGLCVPACAEGALKIVDGKARLVSEVYCDGMGACLGHCPQGAITIEQREAAAYDEQAVERHLSTQPGHRADAAPAHAPQPVAVTPPVAQPECGCPGSRARVIAAPEPVAEPQGNGHAAPRSQLRNWPVELKLAPLQAPYFAGADLLVSADCVPFAYAGFHRRFLQSRTLLIGCPKLDDAQFYESKLTEIFRRNDIRSVSVAFMEVPCCFGLAALVKRALAASGKDIPAQATRISLEGEEQMQFPLDQLPC